jgi:CRISPR-associated protein Cas1
MKKLLNTLYITTQETYLAREGENVLIRVKQETKARFPIHTLAGIVCFGVVNASPPLMQLCAENGVALSFLTENGRFMAGVHGETRGNILLRREQYRRSGNEDESLAVARPIVAAKIANQRAVLQRALRDHGTGESDDGWAEVERAAPRLQRLAEAALRCPALAALRGVEGEAAGIYFGVFDRLITAQKDDFCFRERSRRPPLDRVNALLSFLYVLLAHDVAAACESNGLDPCAGFLHRDRPGRKSLALDLMEELRPHLADRLALSLINRRQVAPAGFRITETGAVEMDADTRKTVLVAWQERKREELGHPFLDEKIHIGLIPHCQTLLLARHLRGDLDTYPPFLWK